MFIRYVNGPKLFPDLCLF